MYRVSYMTYEIVGTVRAGCQRQCPGQRLAITVAVNVSAR
jgi:hypothetical protein